MGSKFSGNIMKLSEKYGGYGPKNLYTASVVEQSKMVVSNLRRSNNTSEKLRILVEYQELELGLRMSIFDERAEPFLGLLTETWLVKEI